MSGAMPLEILRLLRWRYQFMRVALIERPKSGRSPMSQKGRDDPLADTG